MPRAYTFKKKIWRHMARVADAVGDRLPLHHPVWPASPRKILVVRLDQLGDVLQTLPVFEALRAAYPSTEIHFLTTTAGAELFGLTGAVDRCIVWDCPWFGAGRRSSLSLRALARQIRAEGYDGAFELRGDIRLIALLRWAGVGTLVGNGATGGGWWLDIEAPWSPTMHAIDRDLALTEAVGVPVLSRAPRWPQRALPSPSSTRPRIAFHPGAGTLAKRWPVERFVETIVRLRSWAEVVLVGSDRLLGESIVGKVGAATAGALDVSLGVPLPTVPYETYRSVRPDEDTDNGTGRGTFPGIQAPEKWQPEGLSLAIENFMGKTTLQELMGLLRGVDALVSNDSGPAHLMASLGKPVWILWSGTAESAVWSPRGAEITLLENPVWCAPCSLSVCPVPGHPCLSGISTDRLVESLERHFRIAAPAR